LFVVQEGTVLRFALLLPALAERGHAVHIAFVSGKSWQKRGEKVSAPPSRAVRLADELHARFPGVTWSVAPERRAADAWAPVAWVARALADLGINAHPRYENTFPRKRTRKRILKRLPQRTAELEPLMRRWAVRTAERIGTVTSAEQSRAMLRAAARFEDAIPSSREVERYVRDAKPDIVLTTGSFRHISTEVDYMKSARKLGIPSGIFVASWDNLTNKGALKFTPERVFLWNDVQAREAAELHRIPADRIRTTGAHVFDDWFERRPARSRDEFVREVGLDPSRPYLVYLCSSGNVASPGEVEFVRQWVAALRSSADERLRGIGVVVRPHPNQTFQWEEAELEFENAVVWPRHSVHPVASQARADFFDTLAHSAAVVGINTTAMIEASVLGKSVLTILVPEFNQESTLHFHHLRAENGGFLHVAASVGEHLGQVRQVLDEDATGADRRRRFVESFVRPHGIDRPAAPIAAAAIEELATLPVRSRLPAGTRLLRLVLSLETAIVVARRALPGRLRLGRGQGASLPAGWARSPTR
jgi:hypothetical protein